MLIPFTIFAFILAVVFAYAFYHQLIRVRAEIEFGSISVKPILLLCMAFLCMILSLIIAYRTSSLWMEQVWTNL